MAVINKRSRKEPLEAPKKRGRPAGTRSKHAPTVESVRSEWERRYTEMLDYYNKEFDAQEKILRTKINSLEFQAVNYRAVISYLENKIEQLIANSVRGN